MNLRQKKLIIIGSSVTIIIAVIVIVLVFVFNKNLDVSQNESENDVNDETQNTTSNVYIGGTINSTDNNTDSVPGKCNYSSYSKQGSGWVTDEESGNECYKNGFVLVGDETKTKSMTCPIGSSWSLNGITLTESCT